MHDQVLVSPLAITDGIRQVDKKLLGRTEGDIDFAVEYAIPLLPPLTYRARHPMLDLRELYPFSSVNRIVRPRRPIDIVQPQSSDASDVRESSNVVHKPR